MNTLEGSVRDLEQLWIFVSEYSLKLLDRHRFQLCFPFFAHTISNNEPKQFQLLLLQVERTVHVFLLVIRPAPKSVLSTTDIAIDAIYGIHSFSVTLLHAPSSSHFVNLPLCGCAFFQFRIRFAFLCLGLHARRPSFNQNGISFFGIHAPSVTILLILMIEFFPLPTPVRWTQR